MATGRQFQDPTSVTAGAPPETVNPAAVQVLGIDYPVSNDIPTYDSGPVTLTDAFVLFGPVVLATVRSFNGLVLRLWRIDSNVGTVRKVYITNGSDVVIGPALGYDVGPGADMAIPLHRHIISGGIKIRADVAGVVAMQINGYAIVETKSDGTIYP